MGISAAFIGTHYLPRGFNSEISFVMVVVGDGQDYNEVPCSLKIEHTQ